MTKRDRIRASSPKQPEAFETLDVSPLIDVSFLLLIFFLVTSSLTKSEADLKMALPSCSHEGDHVETFTVEIAAHADGVIEFEGTVVSTDPDEHRLPALVAALKDAKALAAASQSPVLAMINADDDLTHQRFTDVINALKAAKLKNIAIADAR
jgi:biopolymer transport protein ExbD